MFEEKDYYMRIVHELVRMLIRLVFNKDIDRDGEEAVPLEVMEKYKKLISMIDDGQINEAETCSWMGWSRTAGRILSLRSCFMKS